MSPFYHEEESQLNAPHHLPSTLFPLISFRLPLQLTPHTHTYHQHITHDRHILQPAGSSLQQKAHTTFHLRTTTVVH